MERSVRVAGHAAGPERSGVEIGRARQRRERHRIEPLDPRDARLLRAGWHRVAQREQLAGLAQHQHRRAERVAMSDDRCALADRRPRDAQGFLRAPRPAVFSGPRARPVARAVALFHSEPLRLRGIE